MSSQPLPVDVPDVVPGWMLACDCCGRPHGGLLDEAYGELPVGLVDPLDSELAGDVVVAWADRVAWEATVAPPLEPNGPPSAWSTDGPLAADAPGDDSALWATPGVTGLGDVERAGVLPSPSPSVAALLDALAGLEQVDPASVPAAQAAVDAQALLQAEQRLRVHDLRRLSDVSKRGLHDLVGHRSPDALVRQARPDGDSRDARFAQLLAGLPVLQAAVLAGDVPLSAAHRVAKALRQVSPHLDSVDGLIDGQPGEDVILAVVDNVVTLVCRDKRGLHDDDPVLVRLLAEAERLQALTGSQRERVEAAFTWLASEISPRLLAGPLEELLLAVLPSELEDRGERGRANRSLDLRPLPDGTGWDLRATLTLESGERLWTALRAEANRDPHGPEDTKAWEAQRDAGLSDDPWAAGLGPLPRPRRQRLHDALDRLLGRYLDAGLGGLMGKNPVQINVTLTDANLGLDGTVQDDGITRTGAGALPPRADSGQLIPRSMLGRWWCDSTVRAFVLSRGGKALRVVHGQRTLTADERRALTIESGGVCIAAGSGCCPGTPDVLTVLVPHHLRGYAENQLTTLDESVWTCETTHHDLHTGKKVLRLRDGRWIAEDGYRDGPHDPPPF